VEGSYPEGRRVLLDWDGLVHILEGVRDLEEELGGFREVLDLGGMGW
jgi:hypothetical protein